MEIILAIIVLGILSGAYMGVTGHHPTLQTLRSIPALRGVESRVQGQRDMRRAVETAIVQQEYMDSRQAIEEEHANRRRAQYSEQESSNPYHYMQSNVPAMSKDDALEALDSKFKRAKLRIGTIDIETVAKFMVDWETKNGKVYPFDPSKGQKSEYHFGSDAQTYDTYIQGGMDYLDELATVKSRVVGRNATINIRKTTQNQLNRSWAARTEATHMMQIEAASSAHERFEAEMKRIEDNASREIESGN